MHLLTLIIGIVAITVFSLDYIGRGIGRNHRSYIPLGLALLTLMLVFQFLIVSDDLVHINT